MAELVRALGTDPEGRKAGREAILRIRSRIAPKRRKAAPKRRAPSRPSKPLTMAGIVKLAGTARSHIDSGKPRKSLTLPEALREAGSLSGALRMVK